ncbi:hypothetical protein [Saccharothrix violaceirubra]|uniref:Uncharacterized protein n=1 Tax=Saccharothrix violaceirubra TaxID=413306 RepID=A0A7W7WWE8_9PSEU|nr:hypothetical protein [Saccharothrix violaceirubra]MBB4966031.1 hypothetical protein [Saccharothrix violaceirubra]
MLSTGKIARNAAKCPSAPGATCSRCGAGPAGTPRRRVGSDLGVWSAKRLTVSRTVTLPCARTTGVSSRAGRTGAVAGRSCHCPTIRSHEWVSANARARRESARSASRSSW